MNNYEWLIARLDAFIRKYYLNQVLRGGIVFLSCLLFYVLSFSVSEYYFYLPVWSRITIDAVFVTLGLSSLIIWVIIPLARMARLGKLISHEQAAQIIGRHFPEISDRLLNILQLKKQNDSFASRDLAEASINQKISQISVVPITRAIDLSKNKKYLPYLLPMLLAGIFILFAAPNVFKEGSSRLLQPTTPFEKPAPFQFVIKNNALIAVRNSDFVLTVETRGNALPAEAYIESGGEKVPMQPLENHAFQYTFKNVTEAINFRVYGAGFYSVPSTLKVVQKPVLKAFKVNISYPPYTGKKDETRSSLSDMTLPVGTRVKWELVTDHTDDASIRFGSGEPVELNHSSAGFGYDFRFMNDTAYTITLHNKESYVADSFRYQVQVIPDQFPVIQVQQFKDTVSGKQVLLTGTAGDDYSITRVTFNYEISYQGKVVGTRSLPVKITPGALSPFEQYFDIQSLSLQPGQKLSYYIEAWDNDGVHGSKSSKSEVMTFFMYNEQQIDSAINENSRQINSGISSSSEKTRQLQSEYKDMQSQMLQSSSLDWEQQQSLQEMMRKQQDLKTQLENIKQRFEEQMQQTDQKKLSDALKEKQQNMDKQLDNLLNQELKDEMKKLEDLMKQLNKDKAVDAMQKMEQENKLFKMDMQRMQDLMNKLEMQMHMEQMANKLDELAKKERDLQDKTDKANPGNKDQKDGDKKDGQASKDQKDSDKKDGQASKDQKDSDKKDGQASKDQKDSDKKDGQASKDQKDGDKKEGKEGKDKNPKSDEELSKEQKDIKDQLDKAMKEDLKEAQKLAKDTRQNDRMEDEEQQGKDAAGDMEDSKESLDKKQNSKASKSQGKAAKKMEEMAAGLRKKAGDMDMEQVEIDIKATRQLLSNLIRLSFDQEDLMENVRHTSASSQAYIDNQETQNRLHSNSLMIRDSLFALSRHMEKLPVFVNKETTELEQSMKLSVDNLENRNIGGAISEEQYVMTHTNNLALMLNEILSNLMQMKNGKPSDEDGSGSCSKPGSKPGTGKKPGKGPGQQLSDIITEQKQMGESMQKMMGGKKPGDKPGDKNGGQKGSKPGEGQNGNTQGQNQEGEYGDPQQLAMLAEQQAKIRRKIQELSSLLNSNGMGNSKELKDIQQKMDKTETDLVNRRLTPDLLLRQKEIETRMLEAEKSLREQEQDDKRSSNSGKDLNRPTPPGLEKYIMAQKQLLELYKTVPPQLKPYYRNMVENYFQIIGNK